MATESGGPSKTPGTGYPSSREQGRARSIALVKKQWHLLVILVLIAAVAGMYVWKNFAVGKTREQLTEKAGRVITQQNEASLQLVMVPLVWAVRSEMIRGNYDQINQYMINFVREPNVNEVVLAKPDGSIVLATNKRLEGTPVAGSFPGTVLQVDKTTVSSLADRGLLAASPVMGISEKLGVLLVVYKPATYALE